MVEPWDPEKDYVIGQFCTFMQKIYAANKVNKGVLPVPVAEVTNQYGSYSNLGELTMLKEMIEEAKGVTLRLNTDETWVMSQ